MTIYVEYIIIDNLIINLLILNITKFALKLKPNKWSLFCSALLGTAVALLYPIMPLWLNLVTKFILCVLMVLIAYQPKKLNKFLTMNLVFVLVTFLFGGVIYGVFSVLNIDILNGADFYYTMEIPLGLILLLLIILFYVLKNLICYFFRKKSIENFIYDAVLTNDEIQISTKVFLDSGNTLVDDNNKPIMLVNYFLFSKLYPKISLANLLLKKLDFLPLKNAHYQDVYSVSKTSTNILVFTIDKVEIFFKTSANINNVNVGLVLGGNNFMTDCIVGPNFLLEDSKWTLKN